MKVIVYSSPACPWCNKVKEFLKEHKIEFEEIDVSKPENRQKAMEMVQRTGQMGIPVTYIGNEIVIGFDENRLKALLKIK